MFRNIIYVCIILNFVCIHAVLQFVYVIALSLILKSSLASFNFCIIIYYACVHVRCTIKLQSCDSYCYLYFKVTLVILTILVNVGV